MSRHDQGFAQISALMAYTIGAWRTRCAFAPTLFRASRGGSVVNVSSEAGSLAGMRTAGAPTAVVRKSVRQLSRKSLPLSSESLCASCPRRIRRRMWRATSHFSPFESGWSLIKERTSSEKVGMARMIDIAVTLASFAPGRSVALRGAC
jgi:hypothetical protein